MLLLRKATAAAIMGVDKISKEFAETFLEKYEKGQMFLIAGICDRVQAGMHAQYGPWYAFVGEFRIRRIGGQEFSAVRAFLPEPLQGMILQGINVAKESVSTAKDAPVVTGEVFEFAYTVGLRLTTTKIGFEYTAGALQAPKPSNAMASLLSSIDADRSFPALSDETAGQLPPTKKLAKTEPQPDVPGQMKMNDAPPSPAPSPAPSGKKK